ncbi:HAD-IA family hydrolase [uncultured Serinicoccus sp.]|uniref:HAD-IA family hydrolase n=1 Tax=uncultured Serinicoccus sp. TaxID=735514 RepID=UPI002616F0B8|nr:HAD-IA family hydrolase [uncultured Serinicoccus sp.]
MRDITQETFEAVLFDNDGTLTDSRGPVERSWRSWAVDHGVDFARFGNFHGVTSRGIVERVAPHLDAEVATADIDRRELEDLDGIVALPGAVDALAAVGPRAAIVTSAGRELAVLRIDAAGLSAPAVLVTADDISRGKPDPEPYLVGARRLEADPARCLVVEDAVAGLESGRAAGAATLALLTTSSREEVAEHADLTVGSLADVRLEVTDAGVRVHLRQG